MFDRLKNIAFFSCIVLLSSCGGGGEEEQSPKPVEPITVPVDTSTPVKPPNVNTHTLSGMAVKGPLANADIFIYTFDASKPHFKGDLIDSGKSSAEALFNDVDIPEPLNDVYIVEIKANSGTVDLNTGRTPIIDTMYTYVTSEQIKLGTRIHATPLTTLVLTATENNLHETSNENDLKQAFLDAKHQVINALNLSIIEDIDLITQVPVVTAEESNLIKIASYRTAIESISALLFHVSQQTNIGINELISTLANDAIDGEIDGAQNGKTIANYESLPSLLVEFKAIDINTLVIPYTKNAETGEPYKVNEVELLLVSEKLILNIDSDVDTSKFSTGEIDITSTPIGEDFDNDNMPDLIDTDDDNDGILDNSDAFPLDSTESLDTDSDGVGNNADTDDDNDGILDSSDAFPLDSSESLDTDHDGSGNNADTDDDNDGILDSSDAFPLDSTESLDTDHDGSGNNADTDDDNDGILDSSDAFPLDSTESLDTDHDGVGNNADTDDDNDGVLDNADDFPFDSAESLDTDNDGVGNNADTDDDNDDEFDGVDAFPLDVFEFIDTDNDGVGDNADDDDDGDGIADNWELFYGLNPLLAADAHEDLDGDSISNLSEFIQDSIPTDDSSITPLIRQVKFSFEDGDVPLGWVIDDEFTNWLVDSVDSSDGHHSLIANNKAAIQYNAYFEGDEISIDVKVGRGTLSLFVDGKRVLSHNGNNMWTTLKVRIAQGNHTIRVESLWGSPIRIDNITIEPLINIFEQDIDVISISTKQLKFYSHNGELFREETIPEGFFTRNFVILDNGEIAFNTGPGSTPVLRIYTPETHTWRYNRINGWQSSLSGMDTLGSYIYMSDASSYSSSSGLIKFDINDGSYIRFGTGHFYYDLSIGPDNNLYAVSLDYKIDVYNPETMALLRTIPLPLDRLKQPRKIVLDDNGNIYILTDLLKILKFNSMGVLLNELVDLPQTTGGRIQLHNGQLVVSFGHNIFIVETDLSSFKLHTDIKFLNSFHNVYNIDEDEDELPLWWENKYGLNDEDSSDADGDKDFDLITNSDEFKINTIPTMADTDGDGLNDGDEVLLHYTDPLSVDTDSDGLSDGEEVNDYLTLPLVFDTDNDQFSDGSEVNVFTSNPNDASSMPEHFDIMLESFEDDTLPLSWMKPADIETTWNINDEQSILGMKSLKAGEVDNFESSEIQFSGVFLKGVFSFSALTNNDICCSVIIFYLDGEQLFVHRSKTWQEYFVYVEAGEHIFKWEYRKNTINDAYIDGGWIDNIQFIKN